MHYSVIVAIFLEHLCAEGEKRQIRQVIVFKNDTLFNIFKEPIESAGGGVFTSQVFFAEKSMDLARPIDRSSDFPRFSAKFFISGPIWSWAVSSNKKLGRSNPADLFKYLLRCVGPIEDKKQYWCSKLLLRHVCSVSFP